MSNDGVNHLKKSCVEVARYPPKLQTDSKGAVEVFGVGPHHDTGFLSLLLQDQVGGLQVIGLVQYFRQCNGWITCLMLIVQPGL